MMGKVKAQEQTDLPWHSDRHQHCRCECISRAEGLFVTHSTITKLVIAMTLLQYSTHIARYCTETSRWATLHQPARPRLSPSHNTWMTQVFEKK